MTLEFILDSIVKPLMAGFALVLVAILVALAFIWISDSSYISFLGKSIPPASPRAKKIWSVMMTILAWVVALFVIWFIGVSILR